MNVEFTFMHALTRIENSVGDVPSALLSFVRAHLSTLDALAGYVHPGGEMEFETAQRESTQCMLQ